MVSSSSSSSPPPPLGSRASNPVLPGEKSGNATPMEQAKWCFSEEQLMLAGDILSKEDQRLLEEMCDKDSTIAEIWERYGRLLKIRKTLELINQQHEKSEKKKKHQKNKDTIHDHDVADVGEWEVLRDFDGIRTAMRMDAQYAACSREGTPKKEASDKENGQKSPPSSPSDNTNRENRIYSFEVEGSCDIEFFPLLSILNEADLYPLWIPTVMGLGLVRADILERVSRTNFVVRLLVKLPFPFAWRRCTFRIRGWDSMTPRDSPKQVLIQLDSLSEEAEALLVAKNKSGGSGASTSTTGGSGTTEFGKKKNAFSTATESAGGRESATNAVDHTHSIVRLASGEASSDEFHSANEQTDSESARATSEVMSVTDFLNLSPNKFAAGATAPTSTTISPEGGTVEEKTKDNKRPKDLQKEDEQAGIKEPRKAKHEQDVDDPYAGSKYCKIHNSALLITPLGEHSTYVSIFVNLVPQIAVIPQFLLNLAFRNLAFLIVEKIRAAKEVTTAPQYRDRQQDPRNSFYTFIKRRMRVDVSQQWCPGDVPNEVENLLEDVAHQRDREDFGRVRNLVLDAQQAKQNGRKSSSTKQDASSSSVEGVLVRDYIKNERRVTCLNAVVGLKVRPGLDWDSRLGKKGQEEQEIASEAEFGIIESLDLATGTVRVKWSVAAGWISSAKAFVGKKYRIGPEFHDLALFFEGDGKL
ncbi:unnamed protein product [Amoebophrya sp. A25]|nr:unnamed protein product [Amoebophrya sp. A25]|eukprot:GSA25T00015477001.1